MKKLLLLLVLLFLIGGVSLAEEGHTTTVMIYMCGSDLESNFGAASEDLDEMLSAGFDTSSTHVIMMLGGSSDWQVGFDASHTMICDIGRRGIRTLWQDELLDMGDPETLSFFLRFAAERYPADEYALILWDHGGGPLKGVCWDLLFSQDNLRLDEVVQALKNSPFADRGLSWIGFDACLMASVEVAGAMAPFTRYMIASQETEPGRGWNYAFLNGLEQDADGLATGQRIIDAYFDAGADTNATLTLSCLDLDAMPQVVDAMDAYFTELSGVLSEDVYSLLSTARQDSRAFGRAVYDAASDYDLVDLSGLARAYAARHPGSSDALSSALSALVAASRANVPDCGGVSVYHPYFNKSRYASDWGGNYPDVAVSPAYAHYIDGFARILLSGRLADWTALETASEQSADGLSQHFHVQLTPEQTANFASAELVILIADGKTASDRTAYFCAYRTDAVTLSPTGELSADYSGRQFYAFDDEGNFHDSWPIFYRLYNGRYYVLAEGRINPYQPKAEYFYLEYELPEGEDELVLCSIFAHEPGTDAWSNRGVDSLSDFYSLSLISFGYPPVYDDNGQLLSFDDWFTSSWHLMGFSLDHSLGLHIRALDSLQHDEAMVALFNITDTQQNTVGTSLMPVTLSARQPLDLDVTLAQDDVSLHLTGYELDVESGHTITLSLDLSSLSGAAYHFSPGAAQLDGRVLSTKLYHYIGGITLVMHPEDVMGVGHVSTITVPVEIIDADNAFRTVVFTAEVDLDLSSFSGSSASSIGGGSMVLDGAELIAEITDVGWGDEMFSAAERTDEEAMSLYFTLHLTNPTDTDVSVWPGMNGGVLVNGQHLFPMSMPNIVLPAGSDGYYTVQLVNRLSSSSIADRSWVPVPLVDNLISFYGIDQIVSFDYDMVGYSHSTSLHLTFDQPIPARYSAENPVFRPLGVMEEARSFSLYQAFTMDRTLRIVLFCEGSLKSSPILSDCRINGLPAEISSQAPAYGLRRSTPSSDAECFTFLAIDLPDGVESVEQFGFTLTTDHSVISASVSLSEPLPVLLGLPTFARCDQMTLASDAQTEAWIHDDDLFLGSSSRLDDARSEGSVIADVTLPIPEGRTVTSASYYVFAPWRVPDDVTLEVPEGSVAVQLLMDRSVSDPGPDGTLRLVAGVHPVITADGQSLPVPAMVFCNFYDAMPLFSGIPLYPVSLWDAEGSLLAECDPHKEQPYLSFNTGLGISNASISSFSQIARQDVAAMTVDLAVAVLPDAAPSELVPLDPFPKLSLYRQTMNTHGQQAAFELVRDYAPDQLRLLVWVKYDNGEHAWFRIDPWRT